MFIVLNVSTKQYLIFILSGSQLKIPASMVVCQRKDSFITTRYYCYMFKSYVFLIKVLILNLQKMHPIQSASQPTNKSKGFTCFIVTINGVPNAAPPEHKRYCKNNIILNKLLTSIYYRSEINSVTISECIIFTSCILQKHFLIIPYIR